MTDTPASRLAELGITLPVPAAPVAAYVPTVEAGGFLYVSGQVSFVDGALVKGRLGDDLTVEQGYEAARGCGLMLLANGLDAITSAQTVVGSRLSWIDMSTERQQAMSEARSSQQQDIGTPDLGSALARLQELSTVLQASQASFSKLAGLSLFDFLR